MASGEASIPKLPPGTPCPREGWELFAKGAAHVLTVWDLLHTAVLEEWGGHGSRSKLEHIIADLISNCEEQWRTRHDLHIDTLDVYLLECLEGDFNIEFEDDTEVTIVSTMIQRLYRECAEGDLEGARAWLQKLAAPEAKRKQRVTGGDDEGSSDSGDEGSDAGGEAAGCDTKESGSGRHPRRVVDEDGWETVVAPKKRTGPPVGAPAVTAASDAVSASPLGSADAVIASAGNRFVIGDETDTEKDSAAAEKAVRSAEAVEEPAAASSVTVEAQSPSSKDAAV